MSKKKQIEEEECDCDPIPYIGLAVFLTLIAFTFIINDNVMVEPEFLDAICKDKNPNWQYEKYSHANDNLFCIEQEKEQLDGTKHYVIVQSGGNEK